MNKKNVIQSLNFGSDVAEHEIKELAKYFVETDQWNRIFDGSVDIIRGAKGSGKSAIYHLMMNKEGELYQRDILLVPAENPNEDPAFSEIRSTLPPTEDEFIGLWKLYLCSVAAIRARDAGVKNQHLLDVLNYLGELRLIEQDISLNTIIRTIADYVKRVFRPSEVLATTHFDPSSGMVTGITGKISFSEPSAEARAKGVRPIREILGKLNLSLRESGQTVWLLLDRLDVAFAEHEEIEVRALRALFSAYKDMAGLEKVKLKIFIRSDIWERIVASGYREATHVSSPVRMAILRWDNSLLFNVFIKRLLQSDLLCQSLAIDRLAALENIALQERLTDRIFPDKVDTGKNPKTFDWICLRLQDGHGQATPRELIQFCSSLRAQQLQRFEKAATPPPEEFLFDRASFKAALIPVSANRLINTIYAEYPAYKPWIDTLRGRKNLQSAETLSTIWSVDIRESNCRSDLLMGIGLFRRLDGPERIFYEIPFLYRSALQIIRGAEVGLRAETRTGIETDADEGDVDEEEIAR